MFRISIDLDFHPLRHFFFPFEGQDFFHARDKLGIMERDDKNSPYSPARNKLNRANVAVFGQIARFVVLFWATKNSLMMKINLNDRITNGSYPHYRYSGVGVPPHLALCKNFARERHTVYQVVN